MDAIQIFADLNDLIVPLRKKVTGRCDIDVSFKTSDHGGYYSLYIWCGGDIAWSRSVERPDEFANTTADLRKWIAEYCTQDDKESARISAVLGFNVVTGAMVAA